MFDIHLFFKGYFFRRHIRPVLILTGWVLKNFLTAPRVHLYIIIRYCRWWRSLFPIHLLFSFTCIFLLDAPFLGSFSFFFFLQEFWLKWAVLLSSVYLSSFILLEVLWHGCHLYVFRFWPYLCTQIPFFFFRLFVLLSLRVLKLQFSKFMETKWWVYCYLRLILKLEEGMIFPPSSAFASALPQF